MSDYVDCKHKDCKYRLDLEHWHYHDGGCEHEKMDGFLCLGVANEGVGIQMTGLDAGCMCEMYMPKGK
jgi:hypothetical protein